MVAWYLLALLKPKPLENFEALPPQPPRPANDLNNPAGVLWSSLFDKLQVSVVAGKKTLRAAFLRRRPVVRRPISSFLTSHVFDQIVNMPTRLHKARKKRGHVSMGHGRIGKQTPPCSSFQLLSV